MTETRTAIRRSKKNDRRKGERREKPGKLLTSQQSKDKYEGWLEKWDTAQRIQAEDDQEE